MLVSYHRTWSGETSLGATKTSQDPLPGRAPTPGLHRAGGLATTRKALPTLQAEGAGLESLCHGPMVTLPPAPLRWQHQEPIRIKPG